jgi:hypothetical protein
VKRNYNLKLVGNDLENIVFISKQSLDRIKFLYIEMPEETRVTLKKIKSSKLQLISEDFSLDSPTDEQSSSLETNFSTDSPSSSGGSYLDQQEETNSQEGKHNQAKTRIEEIEKLNKKLEIKLLTAPKDQVNQNDF